VKAVAGRLREAWSRIEAEAARERATWLSAAGPGAIDVRACGVLVFTALVMIFQEYYGDRPTFDALFSRYAGRRYYLLGEFLWWTGAKLFAYLLVPVLLIKWAGGRLSDFGLALRGAGRHLWIYGLLFAAVLPLVVVASSTAPFLRTYPFYRLAGRSWFDFVAWELAYGASFVALEFFFRGFLLFSLRRVFGAYAIFVMIVPYCMIHFHKPVVEVIGAIFAGVILGGLSMATRSIWCGVAIHVSVAWSMDLLALYRTIGLPGSERFVG
jgi:membrane protease YdiL (CAAX protease family)